MPKLTMYLETSQEALDEGGYLGHVPELPGCTGRGPTKEAAVAATRAAARDMVLQARAAGLALVPDDDPLEFVVEETEDLTLPWDLQSLSDEDLAKVRALASLSRAELLGLIAEAPDAALEFKADDEAWPLAWIIAHIGGAEFWYASRLQAGGKPELVWRVESQRRRLMEQLESVPAGERDRVTDHGGETWTPRKVARRTLEHEREHLSQLRELLDAYARRAADEADAGD